MYVIQINEFSTDIEATVKVIKRVVSYLECHETLESYFK